MATNAGEVKVSLIADSNDLKKGFKDAQNSVSGFSSSAGQFIKNFGAVVAATGAAVVAFGVKSVKAYGEQETAVAALNQALVNQGKFSEATSKDLQNYAASLQKATTYGDELIIGVQAQLASFGLEGEELKKTTKATLDLAAAKKIDLRSAADLLGKAFVGETGTLSRYGIVLGDNIPKTEKFAVAMDKVNQMFGGQAEARARTFTGQVEQLGNAFSDLQEEIGALIAGEGNSLVSLLTTFVEKLSSSIAFIREATIQFGGFGNTLKLVLLESFRAVTNALIWFIRNMTFLGPLFKLIGIDMDAIQEKIEDQIDSWQMSAQESFIAQGIVREAEKEKRTQVQLTTEVIEAETEKRMVTENEFRAAMLEGHMKNEEAKLELSQKFAESMMITSKAWTDFGMRQADNVFRQFGEGTADMIMEGKRFSQVMKDIWRSLARAIIAEIARMMAKWIAFMALKGILTAIGGASGAAAGTMIQGFAGAATGGMINEPSIVTGLRSGRQIVAGEAGAEAIVPMGGGSGGSNMTAREMGTNFTGALSGGGGGITVNISGTFVEGDRSKWQRLTREVIVPEIRRYTMSNPTGPFERRKGVT